jgi:hypothetical protein
MSQQVAQLLVILLFLLVAFGFDLYCLRDLAKTEATFYFPPHVWFYIIIFATPFGGMSYLTVGRPR